MLTSTVIFIQFFFSIIIGLYFLNLLKSQQGNKSAVGKESAKEMEKLRKLRGIKLTEPLSERTRPTSFREIIGQEQGLKALRGALCGPNPQHVLIYGSPGVGKTAAARVVLEEAKKMDISPFKRESKFVEIDATTLRFDERGIADPLIGSVHDPLYQGAGAYGQAGIPQPKQGAVTKAHGGILFIDEIGELHSIQMNKLLKVLEDRAVFLESAYYCSEDRNIPSHIHEIFQKGLPADFRLVGATTRTPEDIPAALRSRCVEIFFRNLSLEEIAVIAKNAADKGGFELEDSCEKLIAEYVTNGREAVNIVQMAGGSRLIEGSNKITRKEIEWVIEFEQLSPRIDKKVVEGKHVGSIYGLAVIGRSQGTVIEIEASAIACDKGKGKMIVTGIIEEEETSQRGQKLRRASTAKASVQNMLTVIKKFFDQDPSDYNIHLNFPGGIPIDGPSAGIAIVTAVYSAINNSPINGTLALTGEISIHGKVKPVGGVVAKVEAAICAGATKVIVPKDNWQESFNSMKIQIIPVENIYEVMENVFSIRQSIDKTILNSEHPGVLTASGI